MRYKRSIYRLPRIPRIYRIPRVYIVYTRGRLCLLKTHARVFFDLFFCGAFWLNDSLHPTAKVSEGTNRNMPARKMLVQLLALYTNPESHDAQRHRQTDGRTERQMTGLCQCLGSLHRLGPVTADTC